MVEPKSGDTEMKKAIAELLPSPFTNSSSLLITKLKGTHWIWKWYVSPIEACYWTNKCKVHSLHVTNFPSYHMQTGKTKLYIVNQNQQPKDAAEVCKPQNVPFEDLNQDAHI